MKLLVRLFLVALLLTTCCIHQPVPRRVPYLPAGTLHLHADTRFAPWERSAIQDACDRLATQTDGLIQVVVDYDLDTYDPVSLTAHQDDDLLLRVVSDATMPSKWGDEHPGETLLGMTVFPTPPNVATDVYLVADQLDTRADWVSVAMHEFLHAVGLEHVADESALMSPGLPMGEPPTCLHYADTMELCRVYGCNVQRVGYCGRGP